jgi:hypothetical protein
VYTSPIKIGFLLNKVNRERKETIMKILNKTTNKIEKIFSYDEIIKENKKTYLFDYERNIGIEVSFINYGIKIYIAIINLNTNKAKSKICQNFKEIKEMINIIGLIG